MSETTETTAPATDDPADLVGVYRFQFIFQGTHAPDVIIDVLEDDDLEDIDLRHFYRAQSVAFIKFHEDGTYTQRAFNTYDIAEITRTAISAAVAEEKKSSYYIFCFKSFEKDLNLADDDDLYDESPSHDARITGRGKHYRRELKHRLYAAIENIFKKHRAYDFITNVRMDIRKAVDQEIQLEEKALPADTSKAPANTSK